ncbi:MAG: preprotein translocase subunit SecE [SAR202 cluster bacterium Io17-Chloro-G4]|nr:MAG: preprotein translocase subunit SecE [SAR202 cluster bacterium Io17-Chloro-G4]
MIAPGAGGKVTPIGFLQETFSELRKSVWPSREETSRLTAVVIALAIAAGFFLGGLDRIFAETFTKYVL